MTPATKRILTSLRLITRFTMMADIPVDDFVAALRSHVDQPRSFLFEQFSRSRKYYVGHVNRDSFEIRQRRGFLESGRAFGKAEGKWSVIGEKFELRVEVSAWHPAMIPFSIFMAVFYLVAFASLMLLGVTFREVSMIVLFMVAHAAIISTYLTYRLRKGVAVLERELWEDLHRVVMEVRNSSANPALTSGV